MKTRSFYLGFFIIIIISFFFFTNFTDRELHNTAVIISKFNETPNLLCPTEVEPLTTAEELCSGLLPTVPNDATILANVDIPDHAVVEWFPSPDIPVMNDGTNCETMLVEFQYQITCTEDPAIVLDGGTHTVEVYPETTAPFVILQQNPVGTCDFEIFPSCSLDEIILPVEPIIPGQTVDIPVSNIPGCVTTFTVEVPECPYLIHVSEVSYEISCNQYVAEFEVFGGTGIYQVDGVQIPENVYISGPIDCSQPYTFAVTDGNPVNEVLVTGLGPDCPEAIVVNEQIIPISQDLIEIQITINGGTPPYFVDGNEINGNVYLGDGPIDCGEPYNFTITDINGCDIYQLNGQTTCPCDVPLTATSSVIGLLGDTYIAQIFIQGGSGVYSVNDMPANGNTYILPLIPCDQNYSVTIIDELGCDTYVIEGMSPCPPPTVVTNVATGSICDDYTTQFTISGGSGYYLVDDIPIAGNVYISDPVDCGQPYTFSVNDANASFEVVVTGDSPDCPEPLEVIEVVLPDDLDMFTIQLDITGGSPPYLVNGIEIEGNVYVGDPLDCGEPYTFTVVDNEGCDNNLVTGETPECSAEIIVSDLETGVLCNQYTAQFMISGGSGTYLVDDLSIPGSIYVSDPIDCGEPYSFVVDDDITTGEVIVSGDSPDCSEPITASVSELGIIGDSYILLIKIEGGTGNYMVNGEDIPGNIYVTVLPCYQHYFFEITDENECDVAIKVGESPCYIDNIASFESPAQVFIPQEDLKELIAHADDTFRDLLEPLQQAFEQSSYLFIFNNPIGNNEIMTVNFSIPQETKAVLLVRDLNGRIIKTLAQQTYSKGSYNIEWDGRSQNGQLIPTGVYFIELQTEMDRKIEKVVKTN